MAYEIFTRKVQRAGSPTISFSKIGQLRFNQSATNILQKEAVEYILLLWDSVEHKLALKITSNKKDPRAYRIHYSEKGNGAGFSAKTFMDHADIDYSERKNLPIEINPNSELFVEVKIPEFFFRKKTQPRIVERGKAS